MADRGGLKARTVVVWSVAAFLLISAAFLPPDGVSNPAWHLAVEIASVVLAWIIGVLALVRFYARRQRIFVFIGTGFLATGVLDAVHAFVSSDLMSGTGFRVSPDVSVWTWLQARVFLSLFLLVSAFGADDGEDASDIRELRVYGLALALTAAVMFVFGLAPTPQTMHPAWLIPRPLELIPALLFGVALVGYLRRGLWRSDPFEFWLVVSMVIATLGHLAFISRSVALYDPFFDAGHLLKLAAYMAVLCGLLVSMHQIFRREAEALRVGAVANQALAREVAVRREAEAVLQRSEQRLQDFLDSAHDLIQSTAPDGRIVYVNRAWEHTLGYARAELDGVQLANLLHPRCRRRVLKKFQRVLEGERVDEILAEFIAKDGSVVVCSGRATRHMVEGEAVATQSIFRDVTAQRAAERELAASRANVQALVENTGDLIWSVDTRHRLVTFNSAFALATEARWGREPVVGDTPGEVFGADDRGWYDELYQRVLRGERFTALREEMVSGQRRAFEIFCNPVHEGLGATGAVMFSRDVTRRLQAEEALRMAKDEAEAANRAKSQFLANMSHELRTPLNSVIGFANILLKNKRENLQEQDMGFLSRILANGRHLLSLINEVLDLAKIEAGRMELDIDDVDLAHLISETVGQLEGQAREREVRLTADLPDPLPAPVRTDAAKLKQVLINLVGNALKFSEGGRVTVRLETDPAGAVTGIAVEDTGIGIAPDRLEAIFEAFAQADESTARRFGGTGLGLAISRSICLLLGYDLEVASAVGEGATFTIRMTPARVAEPPDPPSRQTRDAIAPPDGRSHSAREMQERCVLVVDDQDDARLVMSHFLRDLGCTVLTAGSGEEALDIARRSHPDLITLDLVMPGKTGWDVLKELKADVTTRDIPVVVVSVEAQEHRGRLVGAVDLLTKPVEREDLLRIVWRTLVRRGNARVLVVQSDLRARERIEAALVAAGLDVNTASSGMDAARAVLADAPDAVIIDLGLPGPDAFVLLDRLREHPYHGGLPVVMIRDGALTDEQRAVLDEKASSVIDRSDDLAARVIDTLATFLPLHVG